MEINKIYKTDKYRQEAMQINYKLGNYEYKSCCVCGQIIEDYENSKKGICKECQEEYD